MPLSVKAMALSVKALALSVVAFLVGKGVRFRVSFSRWREKSVFIEGSCLFGAFAYVGAFLRDRYTLSYVAIGFMLSGFGLGGLIYTRSVKWLVRRLGKIGLMGVGGRLMCISFLAIALFQNWILFIPLNILMGLGFYMMHSTLQTQATELTGQTHLKYENPLIAKVWAFYNLGYFSIKILIQQGFQKCRAFALRLKGLGELPYTANTISVLFVPKSNTLLVELGV